MPRGGTARLATPIAFVEKILIPQRSAGLAELARDIILYSSLCLSSTMIDVTRRLPTLPGVYTPNPCPAHFERNRDLLPSATR